MSEMQPHQSARLSHQLSFQTHTLCQLKLIHSLRPLAANGKQKGQKGINKLHNCNVALTQKITKWTYYLKITLVPIVNTLVATAEIKTRNTSK